MKIGFDLDDTLVHNDVFEKVFKKYDIKKEHVNFSQELEYTDINPEAIRDVLDMFKSPYMGALKPVSYAKHVIEELVRHGHEIYIITARAYDMCEITSNLIKTHFTGIDLDNVHYVGSSAKATIIKKLGLEVMVDDNVSYVDELKDTDITLFVISNEDTWGNTGQTDRLLHLAYVQVINNIKQVLFE